MSEQSRITSRRDVTTLAVPLTLLLLAAAAVLPAQPPASPMPLDQLTADQWESLPDEQTVRAGDRETTLGALRQREAARRAEHAARIEAARTRAEERLAALEAERSARRARAAQKEIAEMKSLIRHLDRQATANRDSVRRARELSERRAEARALWIRANGPASDDERVRMEKEYERVLRPVEDPSG